MRRAPRLARAAITVAGAALSATLAGRPAPARAQGPADADRGAAALAPLVAGLGNTLRVLVVGAHPDDEDTQLIAWLARGRHVRTAYLSLTRGDGGQNLIGNELGEALGVIRTQELLAARRIDGGEQFFTRAYDFGFSKSADETLEHWNRDLVLGDMVRIVRAYRPQVVIAMFSGTPRDGHGHHQLSGLLARELFDAAADSVRFTAGGYGRPWTPLKFYRGRYTTPENAPGVVRFNVGAYDPLAGRSVAEVAAESRSQHKSQGQGTLQPKGVRWSWVRREAARVGPARVEDERDLFDGVDGTLARVRGAATPPVAALIDSLQAAIGAAQAAYRPEDPSAAVPSLARATTLAARASALAGLTTSGTPRPDLDLTRTLEDQWRRAQDALVLASGVALEATAAREIVPQATAADSSDTLRVGVTVYNRGRVPLVVDALLPTNTRGGGRVVAASVAPDSAFRDSLRFVPVQVTTQWWRNSGRNGDLFLEAPDGRTEQERETAVESGALRVTARLRVAGAEAYVAVPVVYRLADPVRGEVQRPVAVVPGISVRLDRATTYARAGVPLARAVRVTLTSAYARARRVTVTLSLPKALRADSLSRTATVPAGAPTEVRFVLRGALPEGFDVFGAEARVEDSGDRFVAGGRTIAYEHIAPQRLYYPAATRVSAVQVALPPRAVVGYVQGVGDNVAPMLQDLDLAVQGLDPATLDRQDLSRFATIVVGPRAYEANPALVANNARLLEWVRRGGTLVVQYGQYEMTRPGVMPYPIALARPAQRVTLEEAPVAVLDTSARVLRVPNRIGPKDWADWVQERATYMPTTADPAYRAVVEMHDPQEPANPNALLVAPYGKGTYVYVTLALWRQLPAGNPGAARLFVNLLDAKSAPAPAARAGGRPVQ